MSPNQPAFPPSLPYFCQGLPAVIEKELVKLLPEPRPLITRLFYCILSKCAKFSLFFEWKRNKVYT